MKNETKVFWVTLPVAVLVLAVAGCGVFVSEGPWDLEAAFGVNGDNLPAADVFVLWPDQQALDASARATLWVLEPADHDCQGLLTGSQQPQQDEIIAAQTVAVPRFGTVELQQVPSRNLIFLAEARDQDGIILYRACITQRARKRAGITLTLNCTCNPGSGGSCGPQPEDLHNQRDDDCDGLTDECSNDGDCNDNDECTADICEQDSLSCSNRLVPRPGQEGPRDDPSCSNGSDDDCDGLTDGDDPDCRPCEQDGDCDDGNPCTTDSCNQATHDCEKTNLTGTSCADEFFCNGQETCQDGVCSAGENPCPGPDGDDDCRESCSEKYRNCTGTDPENSPCDDGDPCSFGDVCQAGQCLGIALESEEQAGADACSNGLDDDCDTLTDTDDPDCQHGGCTMGDGAFEQAAAIGTGIKNYGLAAGDFNSDGINDLLVVDYNQGDIGGYLVLLGRSDSLPEKQQLQPFSDGNFCSGPEAVTAADFNGDNILDLAVGCSGSHTVAILAGNGSSGRGDGTFSEKENQYFDGARLPAIVSADFNGDGYLDLAVADFASGEVRILPGSGSYSSGNPWFGASSSVATGCSRVTLAACDFDRDGYQDLVFSCPSNIETYTGSAGGTLEWLQSLDPSDNRATFGAVSCTDINNDATPDLAALQNCSDCPPGLKHNLVTFKGDVGSGLQSSWREVSLSSNSIFEMMAVADLDHDDIIDVVAGASNGSLVTLLGQGGNGVGDGSYVAGGTYSLANWAGQVIAADLDGDAITDLAASLPDGQAVAILIGTGSSGVGDGTFPRRDDYDVGLQPQMVLEHDFNEDGILDLAVTNTEDEVVVMLGDGSGGRGSGAFSDSGRYQVIRNPVGLAAGDLNGDGITDLVVTNRDPDDSQGPPYKYYLSLLWGQGQDGRGDGSFSDTDTRIEVGRDPSWVVSADFNHDGILDLAVNNRRLGETSGAVQVLLGQGTPPQGNGTFAAPIAFDVCKEPRQLLVADVDENHHPDLLLLCGQQDDGTSVVTVLAGDGGGSFTGTFSCSFGSSFRAMAGGDFNDDGVMDVALIDWQEERLYVIAGNGSDGRGDGTFDCDGRSSFTTGDRPGWLASGDFNGDGVTDLVVTLAVDGNDDEVNEVLLFSGTASGGHADGGFLPGQRLSTGRQPVFVTVADFNEDNIQDLAVVNVADGAAGLNIFLGGGQCR